MGAFAQLKFHLPKWLSCVKLTRKWDRTAILVLFLFVSIWIFCIRKHLFNFCVELYWNFYVCNFYSVNFFCQNGHFHNVNPTNPWTEKAFQFCDVSWISFLSVWNILLCMSFTSLIRFLCFGDITNGIVSSICFDKAYVYVFTLYPDMLHNLIINCISFLIEYLEYFIPKIKSFANKSGLKFTRFQVSVGHGVL